MPDTICASENGIISSEHSSYPMLPGHSLYWVNAVIIEERYTIESIECPLYELTVHFTSEYEGFIWACMLPACGSQWWLDMNHFCSSWMYRILILQCNYIPALFMHIIMLQLQYWYTNYCCTWICVGNDHSSHYWNGTRDISNNPLHNNNIMTLLLHMQLGKNWFSCAVWLIINNKRQCSPFWRSKDFQIRMIFEL